MKVFFVGIAGGSGSGKSTISQHVASTVGVATTLLSSDNYYHCLADRAAASRMDVNYDHPEAIDFALMTRHLQSLADGQPVEVPDYCFATHTRTGGTTMRACPVVIVEGILLFHDEEIRNRLDLKVFVDADPEVRLQRRLKRDVAVRGRTEQSVREQWQQTVAPMFDEYVQPTRRYADLTIQTERSNDVALNILTQGISAHLQQSDQQED